MFPEKDDIVSNLLDDPLIYVFMFFRLVPSSLQWSEDNIMINGLVP